LQPCAGEEWGRVMVVVRAKTMAWIRCIAIALSANGNVAQCITQCISCGFGAWKQCLTRNLIFLGMAPQVRSWIDTSGNLWLFPAIRQGQSKSTAMRGIRSGHPKYDPACDHHGMNLREPSIGAPPEPVSFKGSCIRFPGTNEERKSTNDPNHRSRSGTGASRIICGSMPK